MSHQVKLAALIVVSLIVAFIMTQLYPSENMKRGSVQLSILIDKTDSFKASPSIAEIDRLLDFDQDKWKSAEVTINTITNVDFNVVWKYNILPEFSLFSNSLVRDKKVNAFKTSLAMSLDSVARLPIGLPKSSIYPTIANVANEVSSQRHRSIMVVYSDLNENSPLFSVFNKRDIDTLAANPNRIRERFLRSVKIDNLKELRVYFVFQPKNEIENYRFTLLSHLYKSLFEEAGAEVMIGANILD